MKNRESWIDALKGIAILGVVLVHSGGGTELPQSFNQLIGIGANGVQLFFIISAYLTFFSYEKIYKSPQSILDWYRKKFIRLIPLFYLAIIISALTIGGTYWLGSETTITWKNILCHFLFLHGLVPHYANSIIGGEWYIGVLAIFYILTPIFYKYVNSLERAVVLFIASNFFNLVLMKMLMVYVYGKFTYDVEIYEAYFGTFGFMNSLPVLALGIVLFYLRKLNYQKNVSGIDKKLISYATLLGAVIPIKGMAEQINTIKGLSYVSVFGLIFLLIIIGQIMHESRIVCNPVFCMFGKYSYAIYLFHWMFIQGYNSLNLHFQSPWMEWAVRYLTISIISVLISVPVTKYIEAPIVKMLDKISMNQGE